MIHGNTSSVTLAIDVHKAELARVRAMDESVPDQAFTVVTDKEIAARESVALAPCGNEEGLAIKLGYLVALSKADDGDDGLLVAIRTAAETWLDERARDVA
jgi:hypothetical protein